MTVTLGEQVRQSCSGDKLPCLLRLVLCQSSISVHKRTIALPCCRLQHDMGTVCCSQSPRLDWQSYDENSSACFDINSVASVLVGLDLAMPLAEPSEAISI